VSEFAQRLIRWHTRHGRHDLPWQNTTDPYRVWLSEIMLQQTQVATVIPYYARFLARFPTLADLAQAPVDEVMPLWAGLGYYARARNLHKCAQTIAAAHGGVFPRSPEALVSLPGIGRSTANSIATFCFGARAPILDGNVKRLLCRAFGIAGFPGSSAVEKRLWQLATDLMPATDGAVYNQAQMDMGATVCVRGKPLCKQCPVAESCVALREKRIAELPAAKPRKAVPERAACLLVVRDLAGRVLLETRPPAGIWGGLQSLPELPAGREAASWLQQRLGVAPSAVLPAPTWRHAFSHFRLNITPLLCSIDQPHVAGEALWQWVDAAALPGAALPAPVRGILLQAGLLEELKS
jgi:A/G-specific adenine glycosylase